MAFWVNSKISIGKYSFKGVNEVKISKSIHSFTDSCTLTVPTIFRLKQSGLPGTDSSALPANAAFKEADKVTVQLGFNGKYYNEFTGFVRRINFNEPVEIECEGYVYQLRQPLPYNAFVNTTLKNILQYIIRGTDIVLSAAIPDIPVEKFIVKNITGAEVLEQLKRNLFLTIFFIDNELYAGLKYAAYKGNVILRLGWNVVKDNQLKQRLASNVQLQINLIGAKNDGTKTVVKSGNSSFVKNHRTRYVTDEGTLQDIANKILSEQKYDGYEGKITCLGFPFYQHAWTVKLEDLRYPERAGKYFLDSIEVKYGVGGYWRIGGIGIKVS